MRDLAGFDEQMKAILNHIRGVQNQIPASARAAEKHKDRPGAFPTHGMTKIETWVLLEWEDWGPVLAEAGMNGLH